MNAAHVTCPEYEQRGAEVRAWLQAWFGSSQARRQDTQPPILGLVGPTAVGKSYQWQRALAAGFSHVHVVDLDPQLVRTGSQLHETWIEAQQGTQDVMSQMLHGCRGGSGQVVAAKCLVLDHTVMVPRDVWEAIRNLTEAHWGRWKPVPTRRRAPATAAAAAAAAAATAAPRHLFTDDMDPALITHATQYTARRQRWIPWVLHVHRQDFEDVAKRLDPYVLWVHWKPLPTALVAQALVQQPTRVPGRGAYDRMRIALSSKGDWNQLQLQWYWGNTPKDSWLPDPQLLGNVMRRLPGALNSALQDYEHLRNREDVLNVSWYSMLYVTMAQWCTTSAELQRGLEALSWGDIYRRMVLDREEGCNEVDKDLWYWGTIFTAGCTCTRRDTTLQTEALTDAFKAYEQGTLFKVSRRKPYLSVTDFLETQAVATMATIPGDDPHHAGTGTATGTGTGAAAKKTRAKATAAKPAAAKKTRAKATEAKATEAKATEAKATTTAVAAVAAAASPPPDDATQAKATAAAPRGRRKRPVAPVDGASPDAAGPVTTSRVKKPRTTNENP